MLFDTLLLLFFVHTVMSDDVDMDTKMNTITKGAASYLDKPLEMVLVKTIWKNAAWEKILKEKKAPVKASDSPSMLESRNNNTNQNERMTMKMSEKQKNGITIEENINGNGDQDEEDTNYEQDAHHGKSQGTKRKCFSWTPLLELLFQNAVLKLGPGDNIHHIGINESLLDVNVNTLFYFILFFLFRCFSFEDS